MKKEEYYYRLEKAIDFVEANLDKKFSLAAVSKNAFSSLSHFHRIFYFMTGLTIKEYIRRRRLSNAAIQLITTKRTVLDIALEAQFESPESFNKSFKKLFNISPQEFRNNKSEFQVMRRIILKRSEELNQPDNIMLTFVYLPKQIVIGVKTRTTLENSQQAIDIPLFFEKTMKANLLANIPNIIDQQKILGVYSDMSDDEEFDYTTGLLVDQMSMPEGEVYSRHVLPAGEYACFSAQGDVSALEAAWRYIYGDWMPNSGRSRQKGFDFEVYYPEKTDIYIPMNASQLK